MNTPRARLGEDSPPSRDGRYRVPAVEKALAILDLLARNERALGISELHQALDIPKATVFMILNTLEAHQVVRKTESGHYTIGARLYELGNAFLTKLDMAKVAHPHAEALGARTGFTTHVAILDNDQVLFVDKVEPSSFVRFSTYPGLRQDIHICSLGKAIAAHLPEPELDGILRRRRMRACTPYTITTAREFKRNLQTVRDRGFAVEDQEGELNVRCVGAPIFDAAGGAAGAISVTGLATQLGPESDDEIGAIVRDTARRISLELGARDVDRLGA